MDFVDVASAQASVDAKDVQLKDNIVGALSSSAITLRSVCTYDGLQLHVAFDGTELCPHCLITNVTSPRGICILSWLWLGT